MKIEIDLNDLGFTYDEDGDPDGENSIADAIVEAAASKLILQGSMRREVDNRLQEKINTEIDGLVRERVESMFDESIQRTTPWGEKRGEPTTILEMIRESLEKFLSSSGRRRDSFGGRDPVNLQELIDDATKTLMTTELRKTVTEAKQNVHNTITNRALQAAVAELSKK